MKKPHFTREKGEIHIGTIAILILALLVIAAVMMGTGTVTDFFKKIFNLLGAKHENAPVCDHYTVIKGEQDLLDLIYYVEEGYCGGDRPDDAFKFTIDIAPPPAAGANGIEFGTKLPATTACDGGGDAYFCGGHYCNLIGYPEAPETNPVYFQFGDVEMAEGNDCVYKEFKVPFEGSVESQACIESDKSDLIIMGPKELRQGTPACTMAGTAWWCVEGTFGWAENTVDKFIIKEATPGQVALGYKISGWGIRRADENVVMCLLADKV